ncbi:MAG: Gfo/Idh/MocA family oxidoreductase, partial [Candidatus Saccharimonas sp.]|nr:Gfo/Idh/MocA family oxidoreductase [Planctomycetaceae bacterium]
MSDFRSTRRQFVQSVAAAGLLGPAMVSSARAASGPNDRINVGFIGVGTMGRGHLRKLLGQKDVQVVAVCDVVAERRDDAKTIVEEHYAKQNDLGTYSGCAAINDLREVLGRKDVDAVVIATPDHWHAAASVLAARAGKDIYCEKPLTHSIAEGRRIVDTVRSNRVIFQTGSQQRSEFGGLFRKGVEYIRNGAIGRVHTVRVGVGGPPVACDLPEQEIPAGTDWNLWCGPGPLRPYNEVLCPKGVHKHFPAWRQYKEYGGGAMADIGAHHFDIAEWALDMDGSGPVLIEPPAGDTTTGLKFVFSNGVEMFHGGPSGCTFEG